MSIQESLIGVTSPLPAKDSDYHCKFCGVDVHPIERDGFNICPHCDVEVLPKCDYIGCKEVATTKGHVYGHVRDSGDKDSFIAVNACDKHKEADGFFEDSSIS